MMKAASGGEQNLINLSEETLLFKSGFPTGNTYTINAKDSLTMDIEVEVNTAMLLFKIADITSAMVGMTVSRTGDGLADSDVFVICDSDGSNRKTKNVTYTIVDDNVGKTLAFRFWTNVTGERNYENIVVQLA